VGLIEGEIQINRPVDEVFDFVADERNGPRFNPRMLHVELLTPEPIASGSRFLRQSRMLRRSVETEIQLTAFERPRLLGSRSRSVAPGREARPMTTEGTLIFDPMADGTRMRWSWRVETPRTARLTAPLVVLVGRHHEKTIWRNLKRLLEAQAPPA
jgi:uncharacterized membrane protein